MQIELRHFGENLSRGQWSAAGDDVESSNSFSAVFHDKNFGFINGVDNVNWPPYRDSKS